MRPADPSNPTVCLTEEDPYTTVMEGRYWVFDWLDAMGVESQQHIKRLIGEPESLKNLRTAAKANESACRSRIPSHAIRIVAGHAIDLSGHLDCWGWECRMHQVDQLLSRIWLYFDQVVVSDWLTPLLASESFKLTDHRRDRLISDLSLLLRIWKSGAAPFLSFRSKPSVCSHHWPEQIEKLGLKSMQSSALSLAPEVARNATVHTAPCDCGKPDCVRFALSHRLFEHTVWGTFVRQSMDADLKLASAKVALGRYFDHLVSDIWAARYYHSSLGCTLTSHRRFLSGCTEDQESLAFQLELPILGGIDFEHLFRLRQDEAEHFYRFRQALRRAFDERVRRTVESVDGGAIARELANEVIEPSLRSLRDRLKASERLLNKKAATGLFFGSLATTCGMLTGAGPTIAVGAGVSTAVAITSAAASKHLEEKRDAELDDFYFLWKALSHKSHHSSAN